MDDNRSHDSIIFTRNGHFLCTCTSCRSQMAEAIVNNLIGDRWQAFNAGANPDGSVPTMALAACGELTTHDYLRVVGGKHVCIPCSGYER